MSIIEIYQDYQMYLFLW